MKKILIFSTAYLPMIGGAEIAVKEITDRLGNDFSAKGKPAPGWEFDLICARIKKDLPREEKIGRVQVYRIGRGYGKLDKFLLPWQGFKLAKKLNDKEKYDAVWAIMASFGGLAAWIFKSQFPGVPYVLTLQEGDTPAHIRARARWLGPYFKKIFQRADCITAISDYLKDFAKKQNVKCPVQVVPNGVDFKLFAADFGEHKLRELKNKLGKNEGDEFIIHTGRLTEKNGLDQIIRALTYLPPTIKFLAVGKGEQLEKLKKLAEKLKVSERVIFAGEFSHLEMVKYLKISDVFVRPSLSEGLGNSFLEAMATGLPVIGTRVGGIPDFLKDPAEEAGNPTGLFCQVDDPKDLADKIQLLLADDNLRQKIIVNGRNLVIEKYNWNLVAAQMEKIFNQLITTDSADLDTDGADVIKS